MSAPRFCAVVWLVCAAAPALSAFDPSDVLQLEANASLSHDDNLYRIPDVDPALFGIDPDRTSDTIRTVGVGLRLNKTISRQRILVDARFTDIDYERNSDLDHTGHDLRTSWFWQVGNYWDGELAYRRRKYLSGFADIRLTFKDLITSERYIATGGYRFHPRWRIGAEVNMRESRHSAASRRAADFESDGAALSLTYTTPSQNSIGAELRRNKGEYPNRALSGLTLFDSRFTENEVNALVNWRLSGLLRLDGALGWTERKHDNLPQRDFSGATGRLAAIWDPTGKIRVTVVGARDIRSLEDVITNYVLVNSLSVSPVWTITSKIALQGDFIYENRDYEGDPGIVLANATPREDTLRTARIGLLYSPHRAVDLSITYERGERESNRSLNRFDYQVWFGTLRVRF